MTDVSQRVNAPKSDSFSPTHRLPLSAIPRMVWARRMLNDALSAMAMPALGIIAFLMLWAVLSPQVVTSLGKVPGPWQVAEQAQTVWAQHREARVRADQFYARQDDRNAKLLEEGHPEKMRHRAYTGAPTFIDQIKTSLITVALGYVMATLIGIPLGIWCGMSRGAQKALNPLVQIFKPVSPLAWLPIVTMVVSALYVEDLSWLPRSLLVSAITVTLCCIWPTLVNTALGVASVERDLINVGKMLEFSLWQRIRLLIIPAALPLIFTGLRLSLGVGWMVLIAAEMLSQNPGLGKYIWDQFQNGSSQSLANILLTVLTIGIIGFLLDRIMVGFQHITNVSIRKGGQS